ALKEEYEKKLADTRAEVDHIFEDARKNAKKLSEDIVNEAKAEAQNIINRGNKEIELEKAKAIDDLKNQVITISTLLASKIVKENIDKGHSDKLFKETLDEIGEATWQD
ncbi:MAG: ATP synthase F0 subunit B, partial [Lachnospiraceae bacterium]|nr:ATP synthase F0 subunit B [Lachnospiraceae bacterium]